MSTRTATLRLQMIDSVSGPSKATTAALRNLEGEIKKLGKGGFPGAKRLLSDLDYLKEKSAAVGKFTELRRGMAGTFGEFRKARDRVKELERALSSATKPTAKMRAELRTAQSALKQTTSAFNDQKNAALQAERALRMFGLNSRSAISQSQAAMRGQMAQTIQKMRELEREARKQRQQQQQAERARQQSRQQNTRGGVTTGQAAAGIAGGYVATRSTTVAQDAFMKTVDFDQAKSYRDALGYAHGSHREQARGQQRHAACGQEMKDRVAIVSGFCRQRARR